jgi:hypothetical protein
VRFDEVEGVFKQWLYLDHDPDILRIIFAIYLANRYDGLPVWAMLIGKPGCGKSELLGALTNVDETVMVSTLTPNALASGYKDGENSLLHQLKNRKILIVKDMSTFTEMPAEARAQIFATLRDAYDGYFVKRTGTGNIEWRGKFGVLGGATPAIEKVRSYDAALGERFLSIKFNTTDLAEEIIQERSYQNNIRQTQMKKELGAAAVQFFKTTKIQKDTELPEVVVKAIMFSARAMVKARSSVSRDRYTREVDEMVSTSEVPTRVTSQMLLVARACQDIGSDEETTVRIIQRCCIDSVPSVRVRILKSIIEGAERSDDLRNTVRMSKPVIERALEDMWFLKLLDKDKGANWKIRDQAMTDILINTGLATPKREDPM